VRIAIGIALALAGCKGGSSDDHGQDGGPGPGDECSAEVPYDGIDQDCDGADLDDVDGDDVVAEEAGGPDCDDDDAEVFPGASDDVGNDIDEDCDGTDGIDADQDGSASVASGGPDCDDGDDAVHPGANEVWGDGLDQDCAGDCDYDEDGDGFADEGAPVSAGDGCGEPVDCDDTDPNAAFGLVDTTPVQGEAVVTTADFRATFAGDATGATLEVRDAGGTAVLGATTFEGTSSEIAVFTPTEPLVGGEAYSFAVTTACDSELIGVTTLIDPATLPGLGWSLDWGAGNFVAPAGFAPLVPIIVTEAERLLLTPLTGDTVRFGSEEIAAAGTQDTCVETADIALDLAANPLFSTVPTVVHLSLYGYDTPLEDAVLSGRFGNDGREIAGAELVGALNLAPLAPAFGSDVCPLLAAFGIACSACPVSGGNDCLRIDIDAIPVTLEPALVLDPRTAADIAADPLCP
jgi:hypothetical protein